MSCWLASILCRGPARHISQDSGMAGDIIFPRRNTAWPRGRASHPKVCQLNPCPSHVHGKSPSTLTNTKLRPHAFHPLRLTDFPPIQFPLRLLHPARPRRRRPRDQKPPLLPRRHLGPVTQDPRPLRAETQLQRRRLILPDRRNRPERPLRRTQSADADRGRGARG